MVYTLIQFTDTNSGITWVVNYDDSNATLNAVPDVTPTDYVTTAVDMGVAVGTVLYQACEGYTQVTIRADINYPFAIQERQDNSVACGYTGPVGSFTSISNSVNPITNKRTQTYRVGDFVPVGCIYHLTCYGHEVTYVAVAGNSSHDVAVGLSAAINATTTAQWNEFGLAPAPGTLGYPPIASVFASTPNIVLQLNSGNQFGAWVTDGQPTALTFTFTLNKTNESFAGAHDGTVEAITSDTIQLAYTYSLDGINYQVSNVFTGLLPGNYIIYVKGTSVQSSLVKTGNFSIVAGAIPAANIDFPWWDKFCYWFKLIRNGTEYVVSEPIKWDSVNIMGKRDLDWHGWNYQYSDGVIELEFDCPAGKEVIDAEYETNGSDGVVLFQYGYTYKGNDYLLFPGKLNLNTYKEMAGKVACSVEREDFNSILQARFESKVAMDAITTVDGTSIAPPSPVTFTLHSKEILRTFKNDNSAVVQGPQEVFGTGIVYITPDSSAAQLTEIEENYTYPLGYTLSKPYEVDKYNFKIKYAGVYNFNWTYTLQIRIGMAVPVGSSGPFEVYVRTYYRKKNLNGFEQALLRETGPINWIGSNNTVIVTTHDVNTSLNNVQLAIDDEIYWWTEIEWTVNDFVKNIQVNQYYTNIVVTGLDTAPATTCKGWWLFDAIDHGIKVITDKKSLLKSEFLSLKNAQQAIDGGGGLMITTNGKQIRKFDVANAPLQSSVKDLLSSAKAIWCLGMGFEKAGNLEVVRVERANYFFQNREILVIEECWDYKKEAAKDVNYNEFELGYEKYQDSGYNTLDELNTKSEGLTPTQTNKMKLSQKSKLITSGYSIEDSRRQQFAKTSTNSYQNDDEPFLIAMRRVNSADYAPEKNEAFDIVNNVISPATSYNLRLSPIRILLNWAIWLKNAFYYKASTEKIKVTYVAQNATAQTRFKSTEPLPVGDINKSLWTEKQDIELTNYPVAERLWRPEWVTFKCRLTPDKVFTINEALRGRKSSGINYGYIVVKDYDGDYQAGWPYELNYNFATEQADFKMRMKWDSPVTPGADCCKYLVINGCNILINGTKLIV